jgi:hypothetical protein
MAHIANTFFRMNAKYTIISPRQKGFKPNINGCMEHVTKVNELINIVKQQKRDIFICSIDLKYAFGSFPTFADHEKFSSDWCSSEACKFF